MGHLLFTYGMKLLGWLVFEDKDRYLLTNQPKGCVEEIKIRRERLKKPTCHVVGNFP
jgi:hypothetical protein